MTSWMMYRGFGIYYPRHIIYRGFAWLFPWYLSQVKWKVRGLARILVREGENSWVLKSSVVESSGIGEDTCQ